MTGVILWTGIVLAIFGLVKMLISGHIFSHRTGIAHLTAFHDIQPRDKQKAITIILAEKAGTKMFGQENSFQDDEEAQGS